MTERIFLAEFLFSPSIYLKARTFSLFFSFPFSGFDHVDDISRLY